MDLKPDDMTIRTALSAAAGALLGQRALDSVGWLTRLGYLLSCWICAVLFGPALAARLGAAADPVAFSAVVGAVAAFGVVAFDALLRWARQTTPPEMVAQIMGAIRGVWPRGKGEGKSDV